MTFGKTPEHRLSYEDRLTEEAWAIASSKIAYERMGSKWAPWKLNVVTVGLADLMSGKKPDLEIIVPDEEDHYWAKERVDLRIKESLYSLTRLQGAKIVYCALPDIYPINPWMTELNASWNGMRDPLSVDEFFFLAGIPDEELKTVFRYYPENIPPSVSYAEGFFGFTEGGKQRLAGFVGKPIAFVRKRTKGRHPGSWDLSSKEIYSPQLE